MFNQDKSKIKQIIKIIFAVFYIVATALYYFVFKNRKLKKFLKEENREIQELRENKQGFAKFCSDSWHLFQDTFIPNDFNDHKPRVLRPRALMSYVVAAILVKLVVIVVLFVAYPSPAMMAKIMTSRVAELINQARQESGVDEIVVNPILTQSAQAKASDMMERGYFAHDTPEGKKPWEWIIKSNYDYVFAGENLAMDFTSAEAAHNALMKSPSHRKNILNKNYQEFGLAVVSGEMDGRYTDLLVQFFGTQRDYQTAKFVASEQDTQSEKVDQIGRDALNASNDTEKEKIAGEEISLPIIEQEIVEQATNRPDEVEESRDALNASQSKEVEENYVLAQVEPEFNVAGSVVIVAGEKNYQKNFWELLVNYSNLFLLAVLTFVIIALLLNIFVKIRIQDTKMIAQSLAVIALFAALILMKFHFLERFAPYLLIS